MSARFLQFVVVLTILRNLFAPTVDADAAGQPQLPGISTRRNPKLYTRYEVLDPERNYVLEWEVNWERRRILFNVTVRARGYVGFGLSAKGLMDGADMVIGGVDRFGQSYFTDLHGVDSGELGIDQSQDWELHSAAENSSHTTLSFSRPFDTCDEKDYPINERDTVVLLWAYGELDDTSQYPLGIRGQYPVYLLDPTVVPRSLKESSFIPGPPSQALLAQEDLRLWTVTTRYRLPPSRTTYHCSMHKSPSLRRKHHMVAFYTRLESPEAVKHVHHTVLFRCIPPENTPAAAFFERFLSHPGQECYFMATPSGDLPTQYCTRIQYGHSIGMRMFALPETFGVPFGETGTDEYYVMQVHYDNPEMLENVTVEINTDLYYTDRLRANDAGVMTIGHNVVGSPSILIPPSSAAHYVHGHCSPGCTERMFPQEGIFISLVVLHTHNSGQKVKVRHFRGDEELPWLSDDENYSNQYQDLRLLPREVNVRPGDQLTVACEYDNTWTNGSVLAGFGTSYEMCLVYIYYYNRLPDYGLCRSELISPEYNRHYLGVDGISWEQSLLENVGTSPQPLAGLSMTTISDTEVNWNRELREELQQDHRRLPQTVFCSPHPTSSLSQGGPAQLPLATLPHVPRVFVPQRSECSVAGRETHDWERRSHGPRIKI